MREFTAVFRKDGDWWIGWTEELSGANGQGRTIDEARESLRAAVELILEDIREEAACEAEKGVVRERLVIGAA